MREFIFPMLRTNRNFLLGILIFFFTNARAQMSPGETLLPGYHHAVFHEYTWGAHSSIAEPDVDFVKKAMAL